MKRTPTTLAAGLFVLLLAPAALAQQATPQKANTRNLFLSIQAMGAQTSLDVPAFQRERTRGGTLKLGYGFSKAFTLYAGLGVTINESLNFPGSDVGLGNADLGMQLHLGSGQSAFVPYFDVAASRRVAMLSDATGDISLIGYSGAVGGGVKLFVSPTVAIDVNARVTRGVYDQLQSDGVTVDISSYFGVEDLRSNDMTFGVGLSFFPSR